LREEKQEINDMSVLNEIKQLKLAEGTKHTLTDTSTKKELNIEIKDTSEIRKVKKANIIKVNIMPLTMLSMLLIIALVNLTCNSILNGELKEEVLIIFAIAVVTTAVTGFITAITYCEDKLTHGASIALETYRKLQTLLNQADIRDEIFVEIKDTSVDNTSGEIKVEYFNKENNKEFKYIIFEYRDVHYEKDLKTPRLVINTTENSGVQLYLPISDYKNYKKLKEKTN
jgi:hypothetical protein